MSNGSFRSDSTRLFALRPEATTLFGLSTCFSHTSPKKSHKGIQKHLLRAKKWKIGAKKHVLKRLETCFYDVFLQAAGWGSSGEGGKGDRVNPIPSRGSNTSDPS